MKPHIFLVNSKNNFYVKGPGVKVFKTKSQRTVVGPIRRKIIPSIHRNNDFVTRCETLLTRLLTQKTVLKRCLSREGFLTKPTRKYRSTSKLFLSTPQHLSRINILSINRRVSCLHYLIPSIE